MKLSRTRIPIPALLLVTLLWASCKKEVSNQSFEKPQETQNIRASGGVEVDPIWVSKVPMIMSSDLLKNADIASTLLGALKGKPVKPIGDTTPPTVSITSPGNGATVSGSQIVAVSATDNVGVTSVSLTVDKTVVSTLTSAPYSFSWVADGNSHTLTAT